MMKRIIFITPLLILASCGEGYSDLRKFVKDSDQVPRKIEPLPEVKPFAPFAYEGFDLPDPFRPRKLAVKTDTRGGGLSPDLNRRKEPLEAYPLEQLVMVGTLQQAGVMYALVRAERTLYRVKKGNYLGQNFGLITTISDTEIKLKEIVQDTAGDWTERESALPLVEGAGGKS
jgi:type IV pilus assembly protein PilP